VLSAVLTILSVMDSVSVRVRVVSALLTTSSVSDSVSVRVLV